MASKTLPSKSDQVVVGKATRSDAPAKGKRAPARVPVKGRLLLKESTKALAKKTAANSRGSNPSTVQTERLGQVAKRANRAGPEQYARIRVRVEDGVPTIVGTYIVDGPLAQTSEFVGSYAYEVTHENRLLHAGSLPDLTVCRAFIAPDAPEHQRTHNTHAEDSYEFTARVPRAALSKSTLAGISIVLYRVKDRGPVRAFAASGLAADRSLGEQRDRQLREVARVTGLPRSLLAAK